MMSVRELQPTKTMCPETQSDDAFSASGACACREVRFRLESPPMFVHCCHCTWCQRETGSAFAVNALIEANRVTLLQGEPQRVLTPSQSGKGQVIWRCPSCRVALWSNYSGAGEAVRFVRVGTLDRGHGLEPDIHIYTSTRQPWVQIPPTSRCVAEYYDRKVEWPASALERWRVNLPPA